MKAPVGNTCPDIDNCIKWLKVTKASIETAIDTLNYSDLDVPIKVLDALDEAHKYCDIESELEQLRDANSKLRDWGYELLSELKELKRELC